MNLDENNHMQTTSHILMIRPVRFAFNAETAVNNAFQVPGAEQEDVQAKAAREFESFVAMLRENGVDVTVVQDSPEPYTPDSIFPNNWVSFHTDGTLVLYPMFAPNRRLERKAGVLDAVGERFEIRKRLDLTGWEAKSRFLKGRAAWSWTGETGSPMLACHRARIRMCWKTFAAGCNTSRSYSMPLTPGASPSIIPT